METSLTSPPQISELDLSRIQEVMLERVYPDQVKELWDPYIYNAVIAGLPQDLCYDRQQQASIFQMLKMDFMKAYLLVGIGKTIEERYILASLIVTVQVNPYTLKNNLFIWGLFSMSQVDIKWWQQGFACLQQVAKEHDCKLIHAFTNNPRVEEIAKALSPTGVSTFKLLEFNVWETIPDQVQPI